MAKAKKKVAARAPKRAKKANKPKARSASASGRAPKRAAKKVAKAAVKKSAAARAPKSTKPRASKPVKKVARKAVPKAAKRAAAVSASRGPIAPMKADVVSCRAARDVYAGVRIAAEAPERIAPTPRPDAAPLKMLFEMPLERPIAPMDVRPAPLFERGVIPFDTEE